ncbi:hypothetical protein [Sulfurospirillum barnesii]|nr:hypothetical protein [Sulfurospirillum barnesii]
MRAKFLSSTNKGMDCSMPKDVYADITFGKMIWWYLNDVECFRTSKIERFTWDKFTKCLTVFTLNSIYEFELETDEFDEKQIQCAEKEEVESIRMQHETILFEKAMVRVLTAFGFFDVPYVLETPMSFYDAKVFLINKTYNAHGVQGTIMHVLCGFDK